jgi:uncharacterized delta-60 repeat protein
MKLRWFIVLIPLAITGFALSMLVSLGQAGADETAVSQLPPGTTTRLSVSGMMPDPNFGVNGRVKTNLSESSWTQDTVVQPDGKIVVVGGAQSVFGDPDGLAVARYNSDGSPDVSFGNNGTVTTNDTNLGKFLWATAVALQQDGRILVTGILSDTNALAVLRYNTDGTLDNSFGSGGIAATTVISNSSAGHAARDVAVGSDNAIVVVGTVSLFQNSMAVVR